MHRDSNGEPDFFINSINDITVRKKTEQALIESEARYKSFVSQVSEGVYRFEVNEPQSISQPIEDQVLYLSSHLMIAECNPTFLKLLEIKDFNVISDFSARDFFRGGTLQQLYQFFRLFVESGYRVDNYIYKFKNRKGEFRYLKFNALGIIENDCLVRLWGTCTDRTEQKNAEIALMKSEESYRLLIENQGEGVGTVDLNEIFLFANPAADQMFGVPRGTLVNRSLLDFVIPDQLQKIKEQTELRAKNERGTYEFEIRTPAGENRFLLLTATPQIDQHGRITGTFGIFRDMTENVKATAAIKESEERFRSIFEGSPDTFIVADPDSGKILDVNMAATRLLGRSKEELIGMHHLQLHPQSIYEKSRDNFQRLKLRANTGHDSQFNESKALRSDGKEIPIDILASLITMNGKQAILGVFRNATDRKNAEIELVNRERKYRELANSLPISVYETDLTGKITFVNATALEWLNYTEEDIRSGLNISQCVADHDLFRVATRFREVLALELHLNSEYDVKRKDGSTFPVLASTFTIKNEEGAKTGIRGTLVDISSRKDAENKLKKSEQTLSNLIGNLPGFVYRCKNDKDWTMEYLSEGFSKITGYAVSEVLESGSISFNEIIHPDYRNYIWEQAQLTQSLGKPFEEEYPITTKNGETRWVWERGNCIFNEDEKQLLNEGFITDITDRKRFDQIQNVMYTISTAVVATKNLDELLEIIRVQLSTLLDTKNFYIAFYNEKTGMLNAPHFRDQNEEINTWPAEKSLTGYLIKQKRALLITREECCQLVERGEIEIVGSPALLWLGVPLHENEKIFGAFVVQSYDNPTAYGMKDVEMMEFITHQISVFVQRKRAEDELLLALAKAEESDRLKSAFLAMMNHELRTPLNHILGFSELILSDAMPEENISFANSINISGKSLLSIIEDVFDLALAEQSNVKLRLQTFRLMEMFLENKSSFENILQNSGKSDQIHLIFKPEIPLLTHYMIVDRSKVNQILINLFKNAVKFTNVGTIEFGWVSTDPGKITFYIKDTGIGIPKEKQSIIFDYFRQGDDSPTRVYGGIGIGLAISHKISKILKGELSVESEPNKGSTFYLTVPVEFARVGN